LQQKKEAQAKSSRRDIATLIERGKIETARIKIETIINEDIHVELLELLEIYCELLLARFGLLDQKAQEPDPGIIEGVCSVIHAALRTEIKELHILREILMHKYGREFSIAVMENRDGCVSSRVMSKLSTTMPAPELVDAYLREIALAYGVPWLSADEPASTDTTAQEVKADDLTTTLEKTNISVDNISDSVTTTDAVIKPRDHKKPSEPSPPEDDFEMLAKRFADLKKR